MMEQLTENYVRDFFKGKNVLVLGSAHCVAKLEAEFMDGFDVIVRCNNYKIFNECRRTDIYYSFLGGSVKKSMDSIVEDGAKFVFCRCPDADFSHHAGGEYIPGRSYDARTVYEHRKNWFKLPYFVQTTENYESNFLLCDRLLTTGVSSIVDVLRYNPARVYVAGFNFFTTLIHNVDEPCNLNTGHNFPGELQLVKNLYESGKIEVTKEMKKLFAQEDWTWKPRIQ